MNFIGRERQLKQISKEINSDSFNVSLIYGRRRIGKSELVKQAVRNSDAKVIYYECRQITEESNVKNICSIIEDVYNLPTLFQRQDYQLLMYLHQRFWIKPQHQTSMEVIEKKMVLLKRLIVLIQFCM